MPITDLEQKLIERLAEKNDRAYNSDERDNNGPMELIYTQNKILLQLVQELKELRQAIVNGVSIVEEK